MNQPSPLRAESAAPKSASCYPVGEDRFRTSLAMAGFTASAWELAAMSGTALALEPPSFGCIA